MILNMATQINIAKPKIVLENGKPSEVILKWSDFQELLEKIEDSYDLSQIQKMKKGKFSLRDFNVFLKKYAL